MDSGDTVGELIAALADYHPDTPIRLALGPYSSFECTIGKIALAPHDPKDVEGPHCGATLPITRDGTEPTDDPVVWIATGRTVGHLPEIARDALGWSQ